MAIVNTKSEQITDQDAIPRVFASVKSAHARERVSRDWVAVAAADDNGSVYRFVRVHSSWSITSIKLYTRGITGATDYDCGIYEIADNGGAVKNADVYADAVDLTVAAPSLPPTTVIAANNVDGLELRFGDGATADMSFINKRVWEDLLESEDTKRWYDLCLTGNVVGTGAGNIALAVRYVAGD